MVPRIAKCVVLAVVAVAAGVFHVDAARAQHSGSLKLSSLEWAVADSDVIVRAVVADVAAADNWSIVTLDAREMLKGAKADRLQFVTHRFTKGAAQLARAKQSQRELVWLLKRHNPGCGEAPEREQVLARHKLDLYAPLLAGRPGQPTLPIVPLGPSQAEHDFQPPAFLSIDLRVLKTADELVNAIRTAIADSPAREPVRSYAVELPQEIAQRTGFSREQNLNHLEMPVDHRLEAFARRLVRSPGDFVVKDAQGASNHATHARLLRLEGVKALRLFPTESNLALLRAWLEDPASTEPFTEGRKPQSADLVPSRPKNQANQTQVALPEKLADVPEIHFQQPLTKAMKTEDAQLHAAITIDSVNFLNHGKTDAFIETLITKRPDLAGLSFAMGAACRMTPTAGRQFVAALGVLNKTEQPRPEAIGFYQAHAAKEKIDASASVAALMQVYGAEEAKTRLDLAKYLDSLVHADATRALAKLALFSEEPEIRTAALAALKKRDGKDYTDILLAGLTYPWPDIAERASQAVVELGRKDLIPRLVDVLASPDPRAPQVQQANGKKVPVVRELVRVNHHHSCLLCHAPAPRAESSKDEAAQLEGLTAQIPVPSESMVAYYRPSNPDILVRIDVTYLRQDFSINLPVANADPWPAMQRYDFLVRTREVTDQEARTLHELLRPNGVSPYHSAALSALRALTGRNTEPTAAAWRKLLGL
jgi:hypothetical protein